MKYIKLLLPLLLLATIQINASRTKANLIPAKEKVPIMDSLIGTICLAKKFTLITQNEKDFKTYDIKSLIHFYSFIIILANALLITI